MQHSHPSLPVEGRIKHRSPSREKIDRSISEEKIEVSVPAVGETVSSVPAVGNIVSSVPAVGKTVSSVPAVGNILSSVPAEGNIVSSVLAVGKTVSSVPAERKIVSSAPTVERRIEFSKSRGSSNYHPARPRDRPTRSVCTSQDRSRVVTPVPSRRNRSHKRKSSPMLPDRDTTYPH